MEMYQDGVRVWCSPDGAHCILDEDKRNPLEMGDDECPMGCETCHGECMYYVED